MALGKRACAGEKGHFAVPLKLARGNTILGAQKNRLNETVLLSSIGLGCSKELSQ